MSFNKLNLRQNGDALGVLQSDWQNALARAEPDSVVGIRHAALNGEEDYRLHVAAIPERVGCHYHSHGDEDYAVVKGEGTLFWGKVLSGGIIDWENPVDVRVGDSFVIPEGYAHQLKNNNDGDDLVIVFGCPDDHLDDKADRTILSDAPGLTL